MARLHPQQEEQTARRQCRRGEEDDGHRRSHGREPQAEPELQAAHGCRAVEARYPVNVVEMREQRRYTRAAGQREEQG